MTPEVAAILGMGVVILVLLLSVFITSRRMDEEPRKPGLPGETPLLSAEVVPAASQSSTGHVGIDYPDPRTIKVGDTITCQGVRSRVLGLLSLSWRGTQWTEYFLDDGSRRHQWLSIHTREGLNPEDPPHLEVLLWITVPTQGMIPAKTTLSVEGVEFFPVERGTAAFRTEGTTPMPERGLLDFAAYRAEDGRLLRFGRIQGRPWSSSHAQPLPPGSIGIERKG